MKKENLENLKKGVVGILSAVGAVTVANGMMNVIGEKCGDEKFVNKQKKKLVTGKASQVISTNQVLVN